jgi:DNA-binding protein YbaB
MPSPLPDLSATAADAEAAERALANFEGTLAGFPYSTTTGDITVVVDGLLHIVSVDIPPSLLATEAGILAGVAPATGPRLYDNLRIALNDAITEAKLESASLITTFANNLTFLTLDPPPGGTQPGYAGFSGSAADVNSLEASFEAGLSAETAVGLEGPVQVLANGQMTILSVAFSGPLPESAEELGRLTVRAANKALGSVGDAVGADLGGIEDLACGTGKLGYVESEGTSTTFSTTPVDKAVLTLDIPSTTKYLVISVCEFQSDNTNSGPIFAYVQTTIDDTVVGSSQQFQPLTGYSSSDNWVGYASVVCVSLGAGSHTLKVQYYTDTSSRRAWIQRARIVAIPLPTVYSAAQVPYETEAHTTNQNSFDDELTLTFTPVTSEPHLVFAAAQVADQSGSVTVRLARGSPVQSDEGTMRYSPPYYDLMWRTFALVRQYDLTVGVQQVFKIQMMTGDQRGTFPVKAFIKNAQIIAVPLSALPAGSKAYGETEDLQTTTSNTIQAALATISGTSVPYLVIASSILQSQPTSAEAIWSLYTDTYNDQGDNYFEPADANDFVACFHQKRVDWSYGGNHRGAIKVTPGGGAAAVKNARVVILPLPNP